MVWSYLACKPRFAEVVHKTVQDIFGTPVDLRQTTRRHFQQNYLRLF